MPTGFFDLSREIRDEIYRHLWQSMPRLILPYSPTLRVMGFYNSPKPLDPPVQRPPSGIVACSKLLEESLAAFYREGIVQLECGRIYTLRWGEEIKDWARSGRTPMKINNLHMHLELPKEFELKRTQDDEQFATRELTPDSVSLVRHLAEDYIRIGAPNTMQIHLSIVGATKIAMFPLRHELDLAPLTLVGDIAYHMDTLEIIVKDSSRGVRAAQTTRESLCDGVKTYLGDFVPKDMVASVQKEPFELWGGWTGYTWCFRFTKVYWKSLA
jgi:hypothetical protein